jgi:hypothetical protein
VGSDTFAQSPLVSCGKKSGGGGWFGDLRFVSVSASEVLLLRLVLRSDWGGAISSTSSVDGGGATTIITRPELNTYLIEQRSNLKKTVFPFPVEQVRFSKLRQRDVPLPFL